MISLQWPMWTSHFGTSLSQAFSTNGTLPLEGSHFASSPNVRGTMDILWSCLFAVFVCYRVQMRPDLDKKIGPIEERSWQDYLKHILSEGRATIMACLVPEILVAHAWHYNVVVRRLQRKMQEEQDRRHDPGTWTRTHSWYAVMNGFWMQADVVREDHGDPGPEKTSQEEIEAQEMNVEETDGEEGSLDVEPEER